MSCVSQRHFWQQANFLNTNKMNNIREIWFHSVASGQAALSSSLLAHANIADISSIAFSRRAATCLTICHRIMAIVLQQRSQSHWWFYVISAKMMMVDVWLYVMFPTYGDGSSQTSSLVQLIAPRALSWGERFSATGDFPSNSLSLSRTKVTSPSLSRMRMFKTSRGVARGA